MVFFLQGPQILINLIVMGNFAIAVWLQHADDTEKLTAMCESPTKQQGNAQCLMVLVNAVRSIAKDW